MTIVSAQRIQMLAAALYEVFIYTPFNLSEHAPKLDYFLKEFDVTDEEKQELFTHCYSPEAIAHARKHYPDCVPTDEEVRYMKNLFGIGA